jgi:formamidopyrimidine-DNA glycosylase
MPELPEVETVVRQLKPFLLGKSVWRMEVYDPKLSTVDVSAVEGRVIEEIRRLGKQVGIGLSGRSGENSNLWIAVHLRMTGRLITTKNHSGHDKTHLRAGLFLDQGSLLFYDLRRFGTIRLGGSARELLPEAIDPLTRQFTAKKLRELIGNTTTPVKTWLLRQDRLVGLGNIYASEILFRCGIDPRTPAGRLDDSKIASLHRQTRVVLKAAIEMCGTTFSDFQDSQGQSGGFQAFLRVYGREGEPCKSCKQPVVRIVQQQRSTFFCPSCQS